MKALQIQEPVEERNITANIFSVITFWSVKKTDYENKITEDTGYYFVH
jgi:hypothetical protein